MSLANTVGDMGKIASKMLQLGATTTTKEAMQGEMEYMDIEPIVTKQDGLSEDEETCEHETKKIKVMIDGEKTQVIVVPRRTKRKTHKRLEEGQEDEELDQYPHKRSNSIAISPVSNDQYQPQTPADEIEYGDVCITEEDVLNSDPVPELPIEILNGIFDYVKLEDRCMASMVCKSWMKAAWLRVTNMELNLRHRPDQEAVIIRTLEKCENVRSVILRDCYGVSGRVLRHLPATVQSFEFYNCGNFIKTTTNEDVKQLPRDMLSLSLRNCESISDEATPFFPPSLRSLELSGTKVTEVGVSKLPLGLKYLSLSRSLNPLKSLSLPDSLVSLDVSHCVLEDDAFTCLPQSLRSLNLAGCATLTDQHLAQLSTLSELKALTLENSEKISAKGIEALPENLQILNIKQCAGLNDNAIMSIPRNLKEFSINKCKSVTKLGFVKLPATLVSLKLVHTAVTDEMVGMLPQNISKLSLFGCRQITDTALSYLPQNVTDLDVSWTSVTDKGLNCLPARLRKLNVSNTKVTREGIIILENNTHGQVTVAKGPRFFD